MKQTATSSGGQKSKQEKKEAHKAKQKAKKGGDATDTTAPSKEAPTAEALAAVGANQMSQAAAERQAQIDKNRAAWQQRTQAATSTGDASAQDVSAGDASAGDASGPEGQSGGSKGKAGVGSGPGQLAGDRSDGLGDQQAEAAAESAESADDASSSSSEEEQEEEEGEVDTAGSAKVLFIGHVTVTVLLNLAALCVRRGAATS